MEWIAWLPYALLAATSGTVFREIGGAAMWRRQPHWHYLLCYFGLVFFGLITLSLTIKTWEHMPWN